LGTNRKLILACIAALVLSVTSVVLSRIGIHLAAIPALFVATVFFVYILLKLSTNVKVPGITLGLITYIILVASFYILLQ